MLDQALKEIDEVISTAKANTLENFRLVFAKLIEDALLNRNDRNQDIVQRYPEDSKFREIVDNHMTCKLKIYENVIN